MPETNPLTPEVLVPRLGDYLVEKGLISPEDLQKALQIQKAQSKPGQPPATVGQLLVDIGAIDRNSLDQAITEQALQFRAAIQEANLQLRAANEQLEARVKQRTAELQDALEKLSEINKLKSNIVANISHELRTPLTHIQGYLELFLGSTFGDMSKEQIGVLKIMQRSSERLGRLIEDLLMYSISEKDQIFLKLYPSDLDLVCQVNLERSRPKAAEKAISLDYFCAPDLPLTEIDKDKISWVIYQLIDNAIKFTPHSGKVHVRLEMEDKLVKFSITDTGIGIPPERLSELYTPFHQLDGSSTRRYGGTGLGLALVKRIMDAHGSIIRVESKVGEGSHFELLLKSYSKVE